MMKNKKPKFFIIATSDGSWSVTMETLSDYKQVLNATLENNNWDKDVQKNPEL